MKNNPNNVFIDTNVLIGAYCENDTDKRCLQYLYSLKGKRLFISSLSFAQKDIENAMQFEYSDMEDSIQYEISSKFKCGFLITNNIKDYKVFTNVSIVKPQRIRVIEQ